MSQFTYMENVYSVNEYNVKLMYSNSGILNPLQPKNSTSVLWYLVESKLGPKRISSLECTSFPS